MMVVLVSCALTIGMYDFISELLEIASALTAIPMAFTLPALFHYKVAKTTCSKVVDVLFIIGSILISLYVTVEGIMTLVKKLNGEGE